MYIKKLPKGELEWRGWDIQRRNIFNLVAEAEDPDLVEAGFEPVTQHFLMDAPTCCRGDSSSGCNGRLKIDPCVP
ncbi:MAG: hypothetical protein K0S38_665 [Candidatus Paceibacter sp.]|jgi:hypothetical protein|nr:hypothetical protein [Candidatus Paceibacter sp.]